MLLHVKHPFLVVIVLSILLLLNSNILKLHVATFALTYFTHSGADDVHPPFIGDYQCWRSIKTAPLVSSIYLILTYCQNFYLCVHLLASPEMLSMTINATKGGPEPEVKLAIGHYQSSDTIHSALLNGNNH